MVPMRTTMEITIPIYVMASSDCPTSGGMLGASGGMLRGVKSFNGENIYWCHYR